MSSIALTAAPLAQSTSIWPLARMEALRYARHPLFLTGLILGLLASAGERGPIELDYHVIPSFFIGVLGLVVAARLTASTERSRSVIDASPVSETARTAALCLACAVPTAAGILLVLVHHAFVLANPFPDYLYGTYGSTDRYVITMVVPIIACAGGPLLGVAIGRWWRFPGAALLAVIIVLLWSNISGYAPAQAGSLAPRILDGSSLFGRILHMAAPYTAFGTGNGDGEGPTTIVTSYTGSPFWFAVWTVALCGLAVAAALWRGAHGHARRIVGGWFVALAAIALVSLVLAVANGNDRLYDTSRSGTVVAQAGHHGG